MNKQLSNAFSTGGGGTIFETRIQASFVILMLTGGHAPCLPPGRISKIKLQAKKDGFNTDDLIVFVEYKKGSERKIFAQIKHSIRVSGTNKVFSEIIQAAWSDFNNRKIFTKNRDVIALITGQLNATDTSAVYWLLEYARHTEDTDEFFRDVKRANFSSEQKRKKLEVFQSQLKKANNNNEVAQKKVHSFLKHFHILGYDLNCDKGVVLSLLHSHLSQFNIDKQAWLWSRVFEITTTYNQNAKTITLENLPEDIKDAFKQPSYRYFPDKLSTPKRTGSNQSNYDSDLALANLLGAWNENNKNDKTIRDQIIQHFNDREILQLTNSPLVLKNGLWSIPERSNLWDALGSRILDKDIEELKQCALTVLRERDPAFDLPAKERFAASIYGKVLTYSAILRKGLAESLALLGNKPNALTHCSRDKAKDTATLAIRELFKNADWRLWGSLGTRTK